MLQPGDCNHCLYCFILFLHLTFEKHAIPKGFEEAVQRSQENRTGGLAKTSCVAFGVTFSKCGVLLDIRVPLAAFQVSLCLTQESNSGIFIVRGT